MSGKLVLECLNGPLDGHSIEIEAATEWRRTGDGPLAFPWDEELGEPQARFFGEDSAWWLEALPAPHGTYIVNSKQRVEGKIALESDDLLKASGTWLRVLQIG